MNANEFVFGFLQLLFCIFFPFGFLWLMTYFLSDDLGSHRRKIIALNFILVVVLFSFMYFFGDMILEKFLSWIHQINENYQGGLINVYAM